MAVLATLATACSKHHKSSAAAASAAAASASAAASAKPPPTYSHWLATPPSGPVLAILAGKGVGPIRIGATVATIERQMQKKCDVQTATMCRYIGRAVEFDLQGGKVKRIRVERPGRYTKNKNGHVERYGIFNGAIPPDIRTGMKPWAVQRVLGPPHKVEKKDGNGPNHVVEIAHYEGMTLAYDLLQNGNLALGEIRIPE